MKVTSILTTSFLVATVVSIVQSDTRMSQDGLLCAACTVVNGLVDQLTQVHQESHHASFYRLCQMLPKPYSTLCSTYNLFYGGRIIKLLERGETPDTACIIMKMCLAPEAGQAMCHLYPSKLAKKSSWEITRYMENLRKEIPELNQNNNDPRLDICGIPLIGNLVCNFINIHAFSIELPKDDFDLDGFSEKKTLRGSSWRGKDCADRNVNSYPGRKPAYDDGIYDSNCNGIFGVDPQTNIPYEQTLCANSDAKGVIALGDSVTANFHVPSQWFDASIASSYWYQNLTFLLENSLNWPQTSLYTGYEDVDWPILDGSTQSVYRKLRERNLCNHRDYQNLGFNGATTLDAEEYSKTVQRVINNDKPALVIFSYIGNDVCKYVPNEQGQVTTPDQAREGLLATLRNLDAKLPANSHVIVVAVADARVFFEDIHNKIHPFGAVRQDVSYANFYDWLSCIDISPCRGWLTSDDYIRNVTAQRVRDINIALESTVQQYQTSFRNFDLAYLSNPILDVVNTWVQQGGQTWQLVEAFDGFHPNQKAHKLIAEVVWEKLNREHPQVIGPINPNNDKIRQIFGNQGGY